MLGLTKNKQLNPNTTVSQQQIDVNRAHANNAYNIY
jgi:hypothetical protein